MKRYETMTFFLQEIWPIRQGGWPSFPASELADLGGPKMITSVLSLLSWRKLLAIYIWYPLDSPGETAGNRWISKGGTAGNHQHKIEKRFCISQWYCQQAAYKRRKDLDPEWTSEERHMEQEQRKKRTDLRTLRKFYVWDWNSGTLGLYP